MIYRTLRVIHEYSIWIRKNRPDSNRIFQVHFESAVIEYVRTLRYTRRAPIRIRAYSGPNIWLFAQCFSPNINQCTNSYFQTGNVDFSLNELISETFCFLGLLDSRQSNGYRLTETNFVPRFVSLDWRPRLLEVFSGSFAKRNDFIFLLPASRTCSMPRQDLFVLLIKSIVRLSSNRS